MVAGLVEYVKGASNERWRYIRGWKFESQPVSYTPYTDALEIKTVAGAFECLPIVLIDEYSSQHGYQNPEEFLLPLFSSPKFGLKVDQNKTIRWQEIGGHNTFEKFQLSIEKGVTATLIHDITSAKSQRCLEMRLQKGAKLVHIVTLNNTDDILNNMYDQIIVEEGARYELYISSNMTGRMRHLVQVELLGKDATADIRMVSNCANSAEYYVHSEIYHRAESTKSTQLFQSLLYDQSKHSIDSTVTIGEAGQYAESDQRIDHLMLSDNASAFSKPALDICIDEVSCEHGATVSEIDEETLMYLYARGIDHQLAKSIFIDAKINSVYHNSQYKQHLKNALRSGHDKSLA